MTASDRARALAKERSHDLVAPIEAAFARGEISQSEWHRRVLAIVEPAYLAADTAQMGSGHGGTASEWESSRGIVMEAVDRSGTFVDIGCANGLMMESVARWSAERGLVVQPYGIDISARLADLARTRCPQWRDRIWTANADGWDPPIRFAMVRTGLEYVPHCRRRAFARHLLDEVVEPGGRLIVGKNNEDRGRPGIAAELRDWGFAVAGEVRRPHAHPAVETSVVWVDR